MGTSKSELRGRYCRSSRCRRSGFTLVELLTVVAIIALLIGILMPALQGARNQAKKAKTSAAIKSISEALNMFRDENEKEFRTSNGFPPSWRRDDPTVTASQQIYGSQWLIRYLMGKDLDGFVPRRNVPKSLQDPGDDGEQEFWYSPTAYNNAPLQRVGPYLTSDSVTMVKTKDLPGGVPSDYAGEIDMLELPVIVDAFGYPILYYVANARLAEKPGARMAIYNRYTGFDVFDDANLNTAERGIFTFDDNVVFTGAGRDSSECNPPAWDFGAFDAGEEHAISQFETFAGGDYPDAEHAVDDPKTFLFYIMNRQVYDSTYDADVSPPTATMTPHRKSNFMLIAAGKDANYGTNDDVGNFTRD